MSALPLTRATDIITLSVLVDGVELPRTVAVQSAEVLHQANRVPYARLRIADGDAARGDFADSSGEHFVPGREIALNAGYQGETETVFEGIVVCQRIVVRAGTSWLEVDCRDAAFAMTLVRRNRYFEKVTDHAVVERLVGHYADRGVAVGELAATDVTHPQLFQFQASDWDFMVSRVELAGQICVVDAGKVGTLKPSLDAPGIEIGFGATVLELDAEMDARTQSSALKAVAWNPAGQALHEASAADPAWAGNGNLSGAKLSAASGRSEDVVWHGGSLEPDALQSWADGALLRARLAATRGRVRFQGIAAVKPGSVLLLARLSDRFNGKVFVTAVRHEFCGGNWTTDAEFGLPREVHAERVAISHLPAAGIAAAVHGLQIGIVTALSDDPANEHRIRVKVPLAGMDEEGVWARVASPDAGSERGMFFRPEKGDEVVLGFFHADPGQPVVLGMFHSSAKAPPFAATADNDEKGYVSRSGLSLAFDEKKKSVTLATPGGNRLVLSDDDGGIVLEDQNGNKIAMTADGIVLTSAKQAVAIDAKTDFKVQALNVDMKASVGFAADGKAKAKLSSSGTLAVKGSLVMIN